MRTDSQSCQILNDFLAYLSTIKGKSPKTVHEYYLDLRVFFRYLKQKRGLVDDIPFDEIPINDIDIAFVKSITLSDAYDFLMYTVQERPKHGNSDNSEIGLTAPSRARKVSALRSFFKYLTDKAHLLDHNPLQNLEYPSVRRSLPKYLTVDESIALLEAVDGQFKERDYCILMLFLTCGLRVSELCGLNISDIKENQIRVLGKGNKERMLYLNDACIDAINNYLPCRVKPNNNSGNAGALFVSRQRNRIRKTSVEALVKKYLSQAGLDASKFSAHKLRHTAATMMYKNGVDIRTLQDVLGHENLNTTMVYTHINDANMQEAAARNPLASYRKKQKKESNDQS
ncbi:MAG: tyrosine recombinase XerC [Clostridia bacterium]|nr:tyrosine recombinase XerC [Clostridia bacterium]